jgi:hypothetical protein
MLCICSPSSRTPAKVMHDVSTATSPTCQPRCCTMLSAQGTYSNCPMRRSPGLEHVKLQKCIMKYNCIDTSTRCSHPILINWVPNPWSNTTHTYGAHAHVRTPHHGQSRRLTVPRATLRCQDLISCNPRFKCQAPCPCRNRFCTGSKREEYPPLVFKFWLITAQAEPGTPVKQGWRNPPAGMRRTLRSRSWAAD